MLLRYIKRELLCLLLCASFFYGFSAEGIVYVKKTATGNDSGSSWTNAFTSLRDALAYTNSSTDTISILVAQDTFTTEDTLSLEILSSLRIVGGYRAAYDGDTLVTGKTVVTPVASKSRIFKITGSIADTIFILLKNLVIQNGKAEDNGYGGGIYAYYANIYVDNCDFLNNTASGNGGGFYSDNVFWDIRFSTFGYNTANSGGGFFTYYGGVDLVNVLSYRNVAAIEGAGGMTEFSQGCRITNSTFSKNISPYAGSFLYSYYHGDPVFLRIVNSIFWYNWSEDEEGSDGDADTIKSASPAKAISTKAEIAVINLDEGKNLYKTNSGQKQYLIQEQVFYDDPMFIDIDDNNYRLKPCSPCINIGINELFQSSYPDPDYLNIKTDLDYLPRIIDDTIDIGAYESNWGDYSVGVDYANEVLVCRDTVKFHFDYQGIAPWYLIYVNGNDTSYLRFTENSHDTAFLYTGVDTFNFLYFSDSMCVVDVEGQKINAGYIPPLRLSPMYVSASYCDSADVLFEVEIIDGIAVSDTVSWYKDSELVQRSNLLSYHIPAFTKKDVGSYYTVAVDTCGSVQSAPIKISRSLSMDSIIEQRWNNLFFVSNKYDSFTDYQWYKNGEAIEGATKVWYSAGDDLGDELDFEAWYKVRMVNSDGDTLYTCEFQAVRTPKVVLEEGLNVYPNPVRRGQIITVENAEEVWVYDLAGNMVGRYGGSGSSSNNGSSVIGDSGGSNGSGGGNGSVKILAPNKAGIYILKTNTGLWAKIIVSE